MRQLRAMALRSEARLLGLVLLEGGVVHVDVTDDQLPAVQAAVDCGDFVIDGMPQSEPIEVQAEAPDVVEEPKRKGRR